MIIKTGDATSVLILMAIRRFAGNIFSSVRRSRGEEGLSRQFVYITVSRSICGQKNLGKLLFSLVILPLNDFHRCLREFFSAHVPLSHIGDSVGEALKMIFYTIFHGEGKTS